MGNINEKTYIYKQIYFNSMLPYRECTLLKGHGTLVKYCWSIRV